MKYRILAVDDDPSNLLSTRLLLEEWGYDVDTVNNGIDAIRTVQNPTSEYAAILLDYQMPGLNGAQVAAKMQDSALRSMILMYSCDDSREALKYSLKAGALDFVEKDSDPNQLRDTLSLACKKYEETIRVYQPHLDKGKNQALIRSIGLVGQSQEMAKIAQRCVTYQSINNHVLLLGESGSGKGAIALAIHNGAADRFFAINCGAFVNSQLIESELFGYEKGAFTGATQSKAGILQVAGSGTVLLDEVDKMDLKGQVALLRALRERKIRRVGASHEIDISCRIIAAAKSDLKEKMERGEFLPDLYFRLNVLVIKIPPLRERKEDIGLLVEYFCRRYESATGIKRSFRAQAIKMLEGYQWKGNIGELEACIESLLIDSSEEVISPEAVQERFSDSTERPVVTMADLESKYELDKKQLITSAIRGTSKRQAAVKLGVNESSLRTMMSRLGLHVE
jgi:DNA-binding NtrC family response regulator